MTVAQVSAPTQQEVKQAFAVLEAALNAHDFMGGINWETCPIRLLDRIEGQEIQAQEALTSLKGLLIPR